MRLIVAAGVLVTGLLGVLLPGAAQAQPALAPLNGSAARTAIPGKYIVVLRQGTVKTPGVLAPLRRQSRISREYSGALRGFAAALTPAQLAAVRADPQVAYVEADQVVRADVAQNNAPWGLDRIDQRARPLDAVYNFTAAGWGVRAYVIDSGIYAGNSDFGNRVAAGFSAVNDGRGTADCNGHGTHVAGTIGSSTYGVAKLTLLVPVRVLDCTGSGSVSAVIAGVDWVTANHVGASVANMSLGGGVSAALDAAVSRSIASGVTYSVAAGNSATNACANSPARVAAALTVGATDSADRRASYSNYGSCVDVFAPGSGIRSTWFTSPTATSTLSGTSMAAPHVAGVAALYLEKHLTASPAAVASALIAAATPNAVTGAGAGSPNRLLYSLVR
jgi:subtilisin family serine protease